MSSVEERPQLELVGPESPEWEQACLAWNLAVEQRPEAVALVESVDDVVAAIGLARARGWRVAPQGTGHNAAALGPLDGTLLLKTERMRGVEIDPVARSARVQAGTLWLDVVQAAAAHGLAALAGSSPDVGVVGYTLGGGMSFLGRKYGLSSNSVLAVELVTADGRVVRADREHEPELFWALRGGSGNFGVVTELEIGLFPLEKVYAGILWWPIEQGAAVLQTWGELTRNDPPDELTTVGRFLRFPPLPEVPEPVRGKSFVVVEVVHVGEPQEADALLAPLRALEPAMDTIETITLEQLSHMHMDPEHPVPYTGDGMMLAELPAEGIEELVRVAGAESGSQLLSVEVRHIGGELGRSRPGNGALAAVEAEYALYALGLTPASEAVSATRAGVDALLRSLAPWAARHMYMNFADTRRDPASLWDEPSYERLRRLKANVDPTDLIRCNHPVIAASTVV